MTRYEIEEELMSLTHELEEVKQMDEQTARRVYSVDKKAEVIALIKEDIDTYINAMREYDNEDNGMDYAALQRVQGMAVITW